MTGVQVVTVEAECVNRTPAELGLTVPTSGTYKLMLVDGDFAPLCAAADSAVR